MLLLQDWGLKDCNYGYYFDSQDIQLSRTTDYFLEATISISKPMSSSFQGRAFLVRNRSKFYILGLWLSINRVLFFLYFISLCILVFCLHVCLNALFAETERMCAIVWDRSDKWN